MVIWSMLYVSLPLRTELLCISGVPMNDLAHKKNILRGGTCNVGHISSQGTCSIDLCLIIKIFH